MSDASVSENGLRMSDNAEREFSVLTISLYKKYPALWKAGSPYYTNKFMRKKALREITSELKQFKPYYNEQLLRKKINILRTNFNKEFKKRERLRADGLDYEEMNTSCWYYSSMLFLKDENADIESEDEPYVIKPTPSKTRKRKLSLKDEDQAETIEYDSNESEIEVNLKEEYLRHSDNSNYLDNSVNNTNPFEELVYKETSQKSEFFKDLSEYDAVGINVAKKLAKMDPSQALYAESIISNVLRRGLEKKLRSESDVCDGRCRKS